MSLDLQCASIIYYFRYNAQLFCFFFCPKCLCFLVTIIERQKKETVNKKDTLTDRLFF